MTLIRCSYHVQMSAAYWSVRRQGAFHCVFVNCLTNSLLCYLKDFQSQSTAQLRISPLFIMCLWLASYYHRVVCDLRTAPILSENGMIPHTVIFCPEAFITRQTFDFSNLMQGLSAIMNTGYSKCKECIVLLIGADTGGWRNRSPTFIPVSENLSPSL